MTRTDYINTFRNHRNTYNTICRSYGSSALSAEAFVAECRAYVAGQVSYGAARLNTLDTPADWCAVAQELVNEARDRAEDLYSDPF